MELGLKVLFIYPDFLEATKYVKNIPGNYSEGLASLSAVLKEAGHEACLYHQLYMPQRDEFLDAVKGYNPDIIGISIRTSALSFAKEMAQWLDEAFPDIFVWAGMYHPSLAPQEVIELQGIDAVCIGEGEFVCREFVDYFYKHGELNLCQDSFWVKAPDGTVHKNPVRPFITDLDVLPFPDLEIFDYCNLKSNTLQRTAEVIVSRGCIYSCTYCANAQLRNIYPEKKGYARFRSPENAIALLERVLERDPNIECFSFNDAILNVYEEWFYRFTELYKEKIKKKYVCNVRVELLNEKMVQELADSGCYLITIGVECGDEEYRTKYLHRTMKNDHIVKVSHLLKNAGIIVNSYNLIGMPHETIELSLETVKLNARMHTDNIVISFFAPYPSTELREIAVRGGFLDSKVSPDDPVQLRMPDYKKSDMFYIRYSFMKLMRQYRRLYCEFSGERLEREVEKLDKKILASGHPRALIGSFRRQKHWAEVKVKRAASRMLPGVYKALRGLRDKKAAFNAPK